MNIAVTGSIGTGKSTTTTILKKLGYKVFNVDEMVREINTRRDIIEKIGALLGSEMILGSGELNKIKLRELIFASTASREHLNGIIHPEVVKEMKKILFEHAQETIFMEVPLLFEVGLETLFDKIVVVRCSNVLQVERVMKRDGVNKEQAENSVRSQMSVHEKAKKADFVLSSEEGMKQLECEIQELLKKWECTL
ncbi:MAG: dephospho-CoA kinase [Fusobacteria bacterium]|nr:dephospho-CoA kinase [Fusobacteriota bacterium]